MLFCVFLCFLAQAAAPAVPNGPPEEMPMNRAGQNPRPNYIDHPLGSAVFRVPREYFRVGLGSSGFVIRLRADDLGPFHPLPERNLLERGLDVSVGYDPRFPGDDIRRMIGIQRSGILHSPAEEASRLDEPSGPPVPAGLRYLRAAILPGSAYTSRYDILYPETSAAGTGTSAIGEAMFCLSKSSPNMGPALKASGIIPCT